MTANASAYPFVSIDQVLVPQLRGRPLQQGWSPQCLKESSESDDTWGVLKTTAIQLGEFLPEHNKRLPDHLDARPELEVRAGDLLLTCAGPRSRCGIPTLVRHTRPRLMLSGKMYRFRTDEALMDAQFLEYYLMSPRAQAEIDRMKTGVSDSGLNLTHARFLRLEVPLPPLDEQQRIVAVLEDHLSRLDAAETSMSRVLLRADVLERALLASAFSGRVAGQGMTNAEVEGLAEDRRVLWEVAFPSRTLKPPLPAQDTQETHAYAQWPMTSLDAVTDPVRTIRYGILMPRVKDGGEVPYVEVKDLLGDTLNGKVLHRTSRQIDEKFAGARIRVGDVLHAVRGSYDRSAVVPDGMDGANISRDVARIAPLPGISPYFLHLWLRSPQCKAYMTRHARGVAVRGVNIESLRRLPVPLVDRATQDQLVDRLSMELAHLSRVRESAHRCAEQATGLRKALLVAAFSGQLMKEPIGV